MSAKPTNLTPLMFMAVLILCRGVGSVKRPGDPAVESLARNLCKLAVINRCGSLVLKVLFKPRFRIEMMTQETFYKAWKQQHHR